ncbi:hypothetical protein [Castellaniella ginsengisoli]|uniref:Uncharacterized protein n=1 Tax=Castellaniella ginsengisoli TaxID=546114 RepID=A0AB39DPF9_9BURK
MNPHLILARRRAGLHPGYVRAAESKIQAPAEIYAYPAAARIEASKQWRLLELPADPVTPEPAPRAVCGWLVAAYAAAGLALWVVAATVPGA